MGTKERFKERTMVDRLYSRLKDEFGANQVRVRGAAKVMAHLMFGVLALAVDHQARNTRTCQNPSKTFIFQTRPPKSRAFPSSFASPLRKHFKNIPNDFN